ncbi:MAG: hypothetical protein LUF78_04595 [Clostridiales bacterium]|nr:hypothetical protein [Clostridiales bacterium]MCD8153957.1 hypothetical protein [Clostridiales bacterium]
MKRGKGLRRQVTQYEYEHRRLRGQILRMGKSLDEIGQLLDKIAPKDRQKGKK